MWRQYFGAESPSREGAPNPNNTSNNNNITSSSSNNTRPPNPNHNRPLLPVAAEVVQDDVYELVCDFEQFPELNDPTEYGGLSQWDLYKTFGILPAPLCENLLTAWDSNANSFLDLDGRTKSIYHSEFQKGNHPITQRRAIQRQGDSRIHLPFPDLRQELQRSFRTHVHSGGEAVLTGHGNYPRVLQSEMILYDSARMLQETGLWVWLKDDFQQAQVRRRRRNVNDPRSGRDSVCGTPVRPSARPTAPFGAVTPIGRGISFEAQTERKKLDLQEAEFEFKKGHSARQLELDEKRVANEQKQAEAAHNMSSALNNANSTSLLQQQQLQAKDAQIAALQRHPCLAPDGMQEHGRFAVALCEAEDNNRLLLLSAQDKSDLSSNLTKFVWEFPRVQKTIRDYRIVFVQMMEHQIEQIKQILVPYGITFDSSKFPHIVIIDPTSKKLVLELDRDWSSSVSSGTDFIAVLDTVFGGKPPASQPTPSHPNGRVPNHSQQENGQKALQPNLKPPPVAQAPLRKKRGRPKKNRPPTLKELRAAWTPKVGDVVVICSGNLKDMEGTITSDDGQEYYHVELSNGDIKEYHKRSFTLKAHIDQVAENA